MPEINEDIQLQYKQLNNDLITLKAQWRQYRQLFGSALRVEILNRVIPEAGFWIQQSMIDSIILGICRLLDPEKQRGKRNLTFDSLQNVIQNPYNALYMKTSNILEELRQKAEALKERRNKAIAHRDYKYAVGEDELDGFSREDIEVVLDLMVHFMNTVLAHFDGYEMIYDILAGEYEEATGLIIALQKSRVFDNLASEGKLDSESWQQLDDIYVKN